MENEPEKKSLSVNEVAEKIGVKPATVYLWIDWGAIRAKELDPAARRPTYRIPASEVKRILKRKAAGIPLAFRPKQPQQVGC